MFRNFFLFLLFALFFTMWKYISIWKIGSRWNIFYLLILYFPYNKWMNVKFSLQFRNMCSEQWYVDDEWEIEFLFDISYFKWWDIYRCAHWNGWYSVGCSGIYMPIQAMREEKRRKKMHKDDATPEKSSSRYDKQNCSLVMCELGNPISFNMHGSEDVIFAQNIFISFVNLLQTVCALYTIRMQSLFSGQLES